MLRYRYKNRSNYFIIETLHLTGFVFMGNLDHRNTQRGNIVSFGKIIGFIALIFLLATGCVPSAKPPVGSGPSKPEILRSIDSTSIGDILVSENGTLCEVRHKFRKNRELNCGDGVPLWGNTEHHAKHFVRAIKVDDVGYDEAKRTFSNQYQWYCIMASITRRLLFFVEWPYSVAFRTLGTEGWYSNFD